MLVELAHQFLRYASVGVAAFVFHYATLIGLVESDTLTPTPAALAGFVVGGVVSYVLNRRFTFVSDRSHSVAGPRFAVTAAVAMVTVTASDRVLLGVHFPSDVTVGVITGVGLVLASYAGYRRQEGQ